MHRSTALPLLVAIAVVAVVAISANTGPVRFGDPILPLERLNLPLPQQLLEEPAAPAEAGEVASRRDLSVGLVVLGSLVVLALVGLLVAGAVALMRALLAGQRFRRPRRPPPADAELDLSDALQQAVADASAMMRAARDGPAGNTADAVVRCWLALEQVAERAGSPRERTQTPSEFTANLLRTYRADPDAVALLLRLYHQARFSSHPPSPRVAGLAADALEDIGGTLSAATPVDAGDLPP